MATHELLSLAFTSPVNPNWVANPIGKKKEIGIHNTQRLPASCSSIGKGEILTAFVAVRNLVFLVPPKSCPRWQFLQIIWIVNAPMLVVWFFAGNFNQVLRIMPGLRSTIMKLKNRIFRDGDLIFAPGRNLGATNVQMDYDVRANHPAVVQTRCRWIIGDVTEVFDRNIWKLGKIAKMLKNNYFVIRLADCIQLKEFHISSLRVPAAPHCKQSCMADKKSEAMNLKTKLASRGQIPPDVLPRTSNKKRKSTADTSLHPRKRSTQPENAARACVLDAAMAGNRLHHRPPQFIGEETECSVASCSVNDPEGFSNAKKQLQSFGFPDDAMSSCPCTSSMEDAGGAGLLQLQVNYPRD
uniref:Uncharacterized protein n=1 Tax=Oryza brachyantha TaxID=4533 RepID=J3LTP7_ORYBR